MGHVKNMAHYFCIFNSSNWLSRYKFREVNYYEQ